MKSFKLNPWKDEQHIRVLVPGSKSITNRALLLAALAEGKTVLKGVLFSDDSRVFMKALMELGYEVAIQEEKRQVTILSRGTEIPKKEASVYVGSAGTAARFLTAMLALSGGRYEMTSSEQMKARPMRPLLEALEQLGVTFEYKEEPYAFPFTILGRRAVECREVLLNIDESSQFLSALLLAGVLVPGGFDVRLTGVRDARAYVKISMDMMKDFGCDMAKKDKDVYCILPNQSYRGREYWIEPDVSAACYFYGMAAINGGTAQVLHVKRDCSQGDIKFLDVLEKMGCSVEDNEDGVILKAPEDGVLRGVDCRMSDFSDQTMTLAAVAVFAQGPTKIRGVEHIRRQESDRIRGIVTEMTRFGVPCIEYEDGLEITPSEEVLRMYRDGEKEVTFETYEDHRMAMAFALIGTKIPGVTIDNSLCCGKTFEDYFEVLTNLGLSSNMKE